MEYRIHPRTGDKISVIGIGTGPVFETTEREAAAALTYAYEQGVNYLDIATAGAKTFPYAGGGPLAQCGRSCCIRSTSRRLHLRRVRLVAGPGHRQAPGGLAAAGAEDRLHRLRHDPLPGRGEGLAGLSGQRRAGLSAGAEEGRAWCAISA